MSGRETEDVKTVERYGLKGIAGRVAGRTAKIVWPELNFIQIDERRVLILEIGDFVANFEFYLAGKYRKSGLGYRGSWSLRMN